MIELLSALGLKKRQGSCGRGDEYRITSKIQFGLIGIWTVVWVEKKTLGKSD